MQDFQSLPVLYLKAWLLMGACAMAALGFLDIRTRLQEGSGRCIAMLCISLPLGVTGLLVAGYLSLRLMVVLGVRFPVFPSAALSGVVILLGVILFVRREAHERHSRSDGSHQASHRRGATAIFVLLTLAVMGLLPLLPMAVAPDVVFYAGVGTDATGYVRAARSMMEGWYFEPIPTITLRDVLYHSDRAWTYTLIASKERPLAFYLIALVATLCRLNPFQAYLVAESMAIILLSAMALFVVFAFSRFEGFLRASVAVLALALVLMSSLVGDLFRQFLGHAWSMIAGIVIAPGVFWVCLRTRRPNWSLPLAAFVIALIAIGVYDIRYAIFTLMASITAWAVIPMVGWRTRAAAVALAITAATAASVIGGFAGRDLGSLRTFNLNQFPGITLSLDGFLGQAGLEWAPTAWFRYLWMALLAATLIAHGLAFAKGCKASVMTDLTDTGARLISNCAFLLQLGSLLAVLALARMGNDWAAHKTLFWVTAAQVISGTMWLVSMANNRSYPLLAVVSVAVVVSTTVAIQTTLHWTGKVLAHPEACGVIARRGLLEVGSELERVRPDVVWFEGSILEWLVFYSQFHDARWAYLAPYPLWHHGGGLFYRTGQLADPETMPMDGSLARAYKATLSRPEVQDARTIIRVVAADAGAGWPDARCGRSYCLVRMSLDGLMSRALESVR